MAAAPPEAGAEDLLSVIMTRSTIAAVVTFGAQCSIMFGGIVPFLPQYREIRRTGNAEGFSLFVCLTLLVANILRIMFWFARNFEAPLLVQSAVMVVCMLAMIQVCVRVNRLVSIAPIREHQFKGTPRLVPHRKFSDFDREYFWKWTDFSSYLQCTLLFTACSGLFTYVFLEVMPVMETLGFLALFFEAMLGAPQFYRNYIKRNTEGMSVCMVAMWLSGDTFKTGYFLLREAPAQFWICGGLQVMVDLAILSQVVYYGFYPQTAPRPTRQ